MKLDKVHNQLIKYVCFKFVNIAQLACLKNFWIEKFSVSLDSQYMDIGSRLVPNIFPSFLTYTDNFCFVYIVVLPWNFIGCGLCVFFILNNTQYPIQPPSDSIGHKTVSVWECKFVLTTADRHMWVHFKQSTCGALGFCVLTQLICQFLSVTLLTQLLVQISSQRWTQVKKFVQIAIKIKSTKYRVRSI